MAMGSNDSKFAVYSVMGKAMEGGLVSATILTLLLLPVVYSLLDDVRKGPAYLVSWIGRLYHLLRRSRGSGPGTE